MTGKNSSVKIKTALRVILNADFVWNDRYKSDLNIDLYQ